MVFGPFAEFSQIGNVAIALALGYSAVALFAVAVGLRRSKRVPAAHPAVTVLKPLCGDEPRLYENLRSFCVQAYGSYQIVFGANDASDPALDVARRLQAEYPELAIAVTSGSARLGYNRKVENLAHMMAAADHDIVVIADSDIRVEPDYLQRVVAPLDDERVGLVTCLYRAVPAGGLWSRLGALYIDDWFAPSVMTAQLFGGRTFAFGATIAMRRDVLAAIGGFPAIANHLADDYMLGALVRSHGLDTVLSDCVVETLAHEPDLMQLLKHERRWMQTIRLVQPLAYYLMFVSCALPLAVLGLVLAYGQFDALMATLTVLGLRMALRLLRSSGGPLDTLIGLGLVPLRELLTAYAWCRGLFCRRIEWRNRQYELAKDGSLKRRTPTSTTSWDES